MGGSEKAEPGLVIKGHEGCLDHKQDHLRSMGRKATLHSPNIRLGPDLEVECWGCRAGLHPSGTILRIKSGCLPALDNW